MIGFTPSMLFGLKIFDLLCLNPYRINKFTRIYNVIGFIWMSYIVVLHFLELTLNFNGIETVGKTRFTPCIITKYANLCFFAVYAPFVKEPFEIIQQFWPVDKFGAVTGKKMDLINNKWFTFIKGYTTIVFLNIIVMIGKPLLTEGQHLIFDSYNYWNNDIVLYTINFLISSLNLIFIYIPLTLAYDIYFLSFTAQIYVQFELVKTALREFQVGENNQSAIKDIVNEHNKILKCCKALNKWMSPFFLAKCIGFQVQMVSSLYMLTAKGLPPSLSDLQTYGLHFVTVAIIMYMYAHSGAAIYDQSLSVADAAYTIKWHEKGQTSLRKDVALVIMRAQKPELFMAGYLNLNMKAFVMVMENVFSVYGLLATIAADKILARQISKDFN